MSTSTKAAEAAVPGAPDGAEMFDPARHLNADGSPATDVMCYLELACTCGGVRRQHDPPAYLARTVETWRAAHGAGHGAASMVDALAEREARREAAYRAAGNAGQYTPGEPPEGVTGELRAWPDLSTAGTAQNTQEG